MFRYLFGNERGDDPFIILSDIREAYILIGGAWRRISMEDFTIVRSSITIISRAKSSIMKTFAEESAQRRHALCLPRGTFSLEKYKKVLLGENLYPPTRETMARFFSFVSRSMNIMKKGDAIVL